MSKRRWPAERVLSTAFLLSIMGEAGQALSDHTARAFLPWGYTAHTLAARIIALTIDCFVGFGAVVVLVWRAIDLEPKDPR